MKNIDVIIFGGQSNMQGQCERLSERDTVEGAYEYRYLTDTIKPLSNPVGEIIRVDRTEGQPLAILEAKALTEWLREHLTGAASKGYTNLVPEFCRAYIKDSGKEVMAVHVAKGSTTIAQWIPGTQGYDIIVEKTRAAISKAGERYSVGRIFFVWLQGESDAIEGNSKEYYKEKLICLKDGLVRDLGIEKFGIIRVGRFTNDDRDLEIIGAQDEICSESDAFLMLTRIATRLNSDPEYMNPHVLGHYSAKGLETLGREAGKALGEYASIR